MRAGNELLKTLALGLQGEPPWHTDTEPQHQPWYKVENSVIYCKDEPDLPWRIARALPIKKNVKVTGNKLLKQQRIARKLSIKKEIEAKHKRRVKRIKRIRLGRGGTIRQDTIKSTTISNQQAAMMTRW